MKPTIDNLKATNTKFAAFLSDAAARPELSKRERVEKISLCFCFCFWSDFLTFLGNLTLDAWLIKPIQQICRYPLKLGELLKKTNPQHPDYLKYE